ncbi:hypothetical protein HK104_003753 [Borealophlyctis nickersoniae]|nr:hypothetical protein HK104_003753 [Borealophlyctis nickersoniae]
MSAFPPLFANEQAGHEFSILTDFLASLNATFSSQVSPVVVPGIMSGDSAPLTAGPPNGGTSPTSPQSTSSLESKLNSTEKFILTAADPYGETNRNNYEERLTSVIHAKFEAGLLKPYNYVNSYARLQRWMDSHMLPTSRQRVLAVMGLFRPRFRWIAQSLTDIDLVLVEEAFERLLLEYDRVFSSMGIPACLWRRTGEIYKANREFALLVGMPIENLKDGKVCIYELMSEDSAVNYWEKYGSIAFDADQKAVLTSCVLVNPDAAEGLGAGGTRSGLRKGVDCCFSFTIRRDKYNIPLMVAGNFLPVDQPKPL